MFHVIWVISRDHVKGENFKCHNLETMIPCLSGQVYVLTMTLLTYFVSGSSHFESHLANSNFVSCWDSLSFFFEVADWALELSLSLSLGLSLSVYDLSLFQPLIALPPGETYNVCVRDTSPWVVTDRNRENTWVLRTIQEGAQFLLYFRFLV